MLCPEPPVCILSDPFSHDPPSSTQVRTVTHQPELRLDPPASTRAYLNNSQASTCSGESFIIPCVQYLADHIPRYSSSGAGTDITMVKLDPTSPIHDKTPDYDSLHGQDPPLAMEQHLEKTFQLHLTGESNIYDLPSIAGHTPRYGSNSGATHDHIKADGHPANGPGLPPANDLDLHPVTAINTFALDTLDTQPATETLPATEIQLATDMREAHQLNRLATFTKYEHCTIQFDDLWYEITEISSYMDADDHAIVQGMMRRRDWVLRMQKLRMDVVETQNMMTEYTIVDLADKMDSLATIVSQANTQLRTIIDSIRAADEDRGIYTDRTVKSCPRNFPSFAGLESEDFLWFKSQFLKAASDHKIWKADQLDTLRGILTGRALAQLPMSCKDTEAAWTALQASFGDPRTLLNHRLKEFKNMAGLTDLEVKSDPEYASNWYLDYCVAVEGVLEIGKRSSTLAMTCYSSDTICFMTNCLPFMDITTICDSDLVGQDLLQEILNHIRSRRANAQRRAWRAAAKALWVVSPEPPAPGPPDSYISQSCVSRVLYLALSWSGCIVQ